MAKKTYNISELKTIHNFAASYKSKRGKVGVSRQYVETLIKKGRNKDFELVKIDGIKFIYPTTEEIIDEEFLKNAERTERGKIIRPEDGDYNSEIISDEPFTIDQTLYDKEIPIENKKNKKEKEEPLPNQLSLF